MNFTKRRGTTKSGMSVERLKLIFFWQNIIEVVEMEEIPAELIFNWPDWFEFSYSLNLYYGRKGRERQITAVFSGTLSGNFIPMQLIYGGKTIPPILFQRLAYHSLKQSLVK